MPCTVKKTLKKIHEKNCYYIAGVKGNQKNLLKSITSISSKKKNKISAKTEKERNRGRQEERKYELYKNPDKQIQEQWSGLQQIIKVKRQRKTSSGTSVETAYFITNKQSAIEELALGIRNHWLIENSLHWVKDVTFSEDRTKHKENKIAEIKSVMINIAINILRQNEDKYLKRTMRLYCNNIKKMLELLE